jgi:3-oxoacyl-[acyl-carrier-protein] synthase II
VPAEEASRPFDRGRDGFVIAEGAGVLVLEELEHARARGARIYAELAGYGQSCDAGHLTDPDQTGEGPAAAIRAALADAGVDAEAIGYVNAHATSTPSGDAAEARAIGRAGLGAAAVSSTKSMHGHALGGAGGIEAAASLLPLVRGVLPPTINLVDPDEDVGLNHVAGTAREASVEAVLSNSFGFGGHNAALVLRAV